jgi:hypothetical protein
MNDHRFDVFVRFRKTDATRRRVVALGAGAALAALGLGRAEAESTAHQEDTEMNEADDLEQAIQQMRAATKEFINGDPEPWKALCSHADDATLFGGWGGHERGWAELGPRYDWAAARFAGGEMVFEELARYATADLACTIHFERMQARLTGSDETVPINLRVNHIYRREEAGWKLVHRHADALVAIQAPEAVVDQ